MTDIAALAALDGQAFGGECDAFERFCEETEPVPLSTDDFLVQTPVQIHILTHTGTWVTGRACRYGHPSQAPAGVVAVEFDAPIGTSGGPVIDENGLLVGVISQSGAATLYEPTVRAGLDQRCRRQRAAAATWVQFRCHEF
jgi:hypothetical protein